MISGWLLPAAQALLGDWLTSKLRLELEMDEEDDLMCSAERRSPVALASAQPALNYSNFDGTNLRLIVLINQDQCSSNI